MRVIARRAAMVLLLASAACRGSGPQPPAPDSPAEETTLRVTNQAFADATIYVIRSGQRIRLGTVTGLTERVLVIPPNLVFGATPLRFLADPIGSSRTPVSQEITVQPGDQVSLTIPP